MKPKRTKLKTVTIVTIMSCICLLCGIITLFYGTTLFYTGFHNLDYAQNMRLLEDTHDITLYDTMSDLQTRNADELYIIGTNQLRRSLPINIIAGFFFGLVYMAIAYIHDELIGGKNGKTI